MPEYGAFHKGDLAVDDGGLASLVGIFSVLLLVVANGFFVASEFSLVAMRRSRVAQLVAAGRVNAHALQKAVERLDYNLAACQLGITLSSLGLGWIGEPALAHMIVPLLALPFGTGAEIGAHAIAIMIAFAIITILHIVLGELAPKSLALQRTETTALIIVRPLALFGFLLKPAVVSLNGLGNSVLRLFGLRAASEKETLHSPDEIRLLVAETERAGLLARTQREVVERVINLTRRDVSDIMTPRTSIVWADVDDSRDEILNVVRECKHEHVVIGQGSIDEVVGVLRKQDLLDQALEGREVDPLAVLQQPLALSEFTPILQAIERFKTQPVRVGIVVDEYGDLQGIITRTDLLESIAGELPDAGEEPGIQEGDDGKLIIDGKTPFDEAMIHLNINRKPDGDFHTVAGFAIELLGRIPAIGDELTWEGWSFRIMEMDGPRISKLVALRSNA
ncbi:Hemolysins and related proteins [Nitrobacter sp. Nb-311A]|nr:Hemolysins and related proteins [Nitrobacter sp. Nb-311A]